MANKITFVPKTPLWDFPTFRHANILNQAIAKVVRLVTQKLTDFVRRLPRSRHHVYVPEVAMKDLSKTQSRIDMQKFEPNVKYINISKKLFCCVPSIPHQESQQTLRICRNPENKFDIIGLMAYLLTNQRNKLLAPTLYI